MQNGVVGILCECAHTSVIYIIPSQALTLPAICFPCGLLQLGFSAQRSGANRNRGRFWLWFGGAESTGHFWGQTCGYSRMRGSLIKEQGRGYVMYSGPEQAMASEDAVACIKAHALRVSALASRFGRSRSGWYFTPAIQFTPIILHPHICRALLLPHAGGHDQPSPPTTILMPTPAAITYGQPCEIKVSGVGSQYLVLSPPRSMHIASHLGAPPTKLEECVKGTDKAPVSWASLIFATVVHSVVLFFSAGGPKSTLMGRDLS